MSSLRPPVAIAFVAKTSSNHNNIPKRGVNRSDPPLLSQQQSYTSDHEASIPPITPLVRKPSLIVKTLSSSSLSSLEVDINVTCSYEKRRKPKKTESNDEINSQHAVYGRRRKVNPTKTVETNKARAHSSDEIQRPQSQSTQRKMRRNRPSFTSISSWEREQLVNKLSNVVLNECTKEQKQKRRQRNQRSKDMDAVTQRLNLIDQVLYHVDLAVQNRILKTKSDEKPGKVRSSKYCYDSSDQDSISTTSNQKPMKHDIHPTVPRYYSSEDEERTQQQHHPSLRAMTKLLEKKKITPTPSKTTTVELQCSDPTMSMTDFDSSINDFVAISENTTWKNK